ncbi:RteC domain-containing protein [Chryseobacterium sp. G0162]|uniref:RteC domain-containing protein n=1 Tax=Chryseobacterium sp. G0162 TaxID=2487063 RepID=UPI001E6554AE|nr:RteC domain-containing protein [Chryseobacterium sp. G0162]
MQISTFYDYKVARIISYDLLQAYLSSKFTKPAYQENEVLDINEDAEFSWTDSKNALIELIYALHISRSVSNGKAGITRTRQILSLRYRSSYKMNN